MPEIDMDRFFPGRTSQASGISGRGYTNKIEITRKWRSSTAKGVTGEGEPPQTFEEWFAENGVPLACGVVVGFTYYQAQHHPIEYAPLIEASGSFINNIMNGLGQIGGAVGNIIEGITPW